MFYSKKLQKGPKQQTPFTVCKYISSHQSRFETIEKRLLSAISLFEQIEFALFVDFIL